MILLDIGYQKIQMRYFWIRIFFQIGLDLDFLFKSFVVKLNVNISLCILLPFSHIETRA